jgi:hypothetical protein
MNASRFEIPFHRIEPLFKRLSPGAAIAEVEIL